MTTPPPPTPPPGWYPNPQGGGTAYWNGSEWVAPPTPPTVRRSRDNRTVLMVAGGLLVLVLVGSCIANVFKGDDKTSTTTTSSHMAAPAPSTTRAPAGPTMDPEPGKAYKIDDCFLCTEPPGTWETRGAKGPGPCTWFIQADLTGSIDSLIDSGSTGPDEPARVALKRGQYFASRNCLPWRFVG